MIDCSHVNPCFFVMCWRILRVVPKWQELAAITINHLPLIAKTTLTKQPASTISGSDTSEVEQTVLTCEESRAISLPRYSKRHY